jgi:hypothetical protein
MTPSHNTNLYSIARINRFFTAESYESGRSPACLNVGDASKQGRGDPIPGNQLII